MSLVLAPPLSLRASQADDRALLEDIYASTRADELALTDWSQADQAAFIRMQFSAQDAHYRLHYPGAQFWLVCHQSIPAGRLYWHDRDSERRIMDLALLPAYRNRGYGSQVLLALQADATASGIGLSIHVERFNPARQLYARLGFGLKQEGEVYNLLEWIPATSIESRVLENDHA